MTDWAIASINPQSPTYFQALRSQARVSFIQTPRADFHVRKIGAAKSIATDPVLADFDQVPILGNDGAWIENVYVRGRGLMGLNAGMFMSAEAPLLDFIETADSQPFRFLLERGDVCGLVTLSDLQKLPVYGALFGLVIAVEMLLMECIRHRCGNHPDFWVACLAAREKQRLEEHWLRAKVSNVMIDRLSCASLSQEIKAALFCDVIAPSSEEEKALLCLKKLRNQVCHGSQIAPSPELALRIPGQVRNAMRLAQFFRERLESQEFSRL